MASSEPASAAGNYAALDKALHHLALRSRVLRAVSFDIDCALARGDVAGTSQQPHVFISGLARAGTSVMLRALHTSGCFATLSYRDMPFVLAPGLWRRISLRHRRPAAMVERAHGDRLKVGFDSPEAFEEVFWLTFLGAGYVHDSRLSDHQVDAEVIERFRRYVANIVSLHGHSGELRYLSKNNNNLLRLSALKQALPAAHIIIPFRSPYQQARSLLRQHKRFSALQDQDPFVLCYMTWLGHFEFGRNHRPFVFGQATGPGKGGDPQSIDYWLAYWAHVYRAVLQGAPDDAVFLDYERLCERPREMLAAVADLIGVDRANVEGASSTLMPPSPYEDDGASDPAILAESMEVHAALRARALRPAQP
jgi:hypothetical protein